MRRRLVVYGASASPMNSTEVARSGEVIVQLRVMS